MAAQLTVGKIVCTIGREPLWAIFCRCFVGTERKHKFVALKSQYAAPDIVLAAELEITQIDGPRARPCNQPTLVREVVSSDGESKGLARYD